MLLWTTLLLTVWPLKLLIPMKPETVSADSKVRITPSLLVVTMPSSNVPTLLLLSKKLPLPLVSMLPVFNSTLVVFSLSVVPVSTTVFYSLVTTLIPLVLTGRLRTLGVLLSVNMVISDSLLPLLVVRLPTPALFAPELMLLTSEKSVLKNIPKIL